MSIDQFLFFHCVLWQDHVDDNKSVFLQQDGCAPLRLTQSVGCCAKDELQRLCKWIYFNRRNHAAVVWQQRKKVAVTSEQRSSILPGTLPVTQLRGHKSPDAQSKGSQDTQIAAIYEVFPRTAGSHRKHVMIYSYSRPTCSHGLIIRSSAACPAWTYDLQFKFTDFHSENKILLFVTVLY